MARRFVLPVGVVAAVAVAGVAAAAAADRSGKSDLVLRGVQTQAVEVSVDGEFLGDRFVGAEDLFTGSTKTGRAVRSCEVLATTGGGEATFQCLFTLALADGTLTLQAMPELTERGLENVTAAVTGGTGAYRNARGEAFLEELSPVETRYSVDWR